MISNKGHGICGITLEKLATREHYNNNENNRHFLSALKYVACVQVLTRRKGSNNVYMKSFNSDEDAFDTVDQSESTPFGHNESGTKVHVRNIFDQIPVRRKAFRLEEEVLAVKDFMRNMSILHHTVTWSLVLGQPDSVQLQSNISACKYVLAIVPQRSVSKQLLCLYGPNNIENLEVFFFLLRTLVSNGKIT